MTVEAIGLGKNYGKTRAVDQLSFRLEPGVVTGFLGPNGSGKSTTMRLMLGLDRGDGETLWDGLPLRSHKPVSRVVGAHLDAKFFHPSRSARNHLRLLATEARIPKSRVDEVLTLVGLDEVARKRPSGFSLGMGQRLGLAGAILAEPQVLLLDEPANGLDPQSIQWLRDFLRSYAERGNVVFVSSHLLSEMQLMADHLIVIAAGQMIADESLAQFVARSSLNDVFVRCSDPAALASAMATVGVTSKPEGDDGLSVAIADTDWVGDAAFRFGITIRELTRRTASLEEAFLEMTSGTQQFQVGAPKEESA
ncbi:MAG: ATP-binding cassette domain-containing protein [Actinomycetes bacterium]